MVTSATLDDVCFVARRVLAMLRDPRTNAERLGRVIDQVPPLADLVQGAANDVFGDRGRIGTSSQAVTVMGFDRLEAQIRRFLYVQFQLLEQEAAAERTPAPLALRAPARRYDELDAERLERVRAGVRYAAVM